MGIDYSITYGYGFAVDENRLPDFLKDGEWGMDAWDISQWLQGNGYEEIDCDTVGNYMSGETFIFFYWPATYFHTESRMFDDVHDLPDEPVEGAKGVLRQLADKLGYTGKIGWKVAGNVS